MTDAGDNDTSVKTLPAEIPGEVRILWSRLITDRLMILKNISTTRKETNSIIFIRLGYIHLNKIYGRGQLAIKIIVHYPETPEKQAQFDARVAKFHAEYVAQYIEKLNCPTEQKLKLLDAVAQTIMEQTEENLKS